MTKEDVIVAAVAEPRPDGEKIVQAIVEYPGAAKDVREIQAVGRTVISRSVEGDKVTLFLSETDPEADVIPKWHGPGGPGKPGGPGGPGGPGKPGGPPKEMPRDKNGPILPQLKRKEIAVTVSVPGIASEIRSQRTIERIIDDFKQFQYKNIPYNLYSPKNIAPGKVYPLVMFIPDASPNGPDPLLALSQGIGATCWAEERWQEKHPCFVLAIQVPKEVHLVNDLNEAAPELETIKEIVDQIITEYPVDAGRVYATGQSQGCMASCELNVRYPEFFAASLLVSGQWNSETMGKLTKSKFFICLSSGGVREYPGMNSITEELERNGATVSRVHLNFRDGWDSINQKVRTAAEGQRFVYAIFDAETAFPDDGWERPRPMHHNRGWQLAYQMDAAKEWLFAQAK